MRDIWRCTKTRVGDGVRPGASHGDCGRHHLSRCSRTAYQTASLRTERARWSTGHWSPRPRLSSRVASSLVSRHSPGACSADQAVRLSGCQDVRLSGYKASVCCLPSAVCRLPYAVRHPPPGLVKEGRQDTGKGSNLHGGSGRAEPLLQTREGRAPLACVYGRRWSPAANCVGLHQSSAVSLTRPINVTSLSAEAMLIIGNP